MLYNDFNGLNVSRLGFGCMRFSTDPVTGAIDQDKVDAMFDLAFSRGVNYYDTAYPYLDGNSEIAMAKALEKHPRESYFIADKFPGHSLPGPVDNVALFHKSLEKCKTDYFDFYLLHNINEWSLKTYESPEYHIIPDMIRMRDEGKIRNLGFSFHGGVDLLREFLDKYDGIFSFVQIQCNYMDWSMQRSKEKYRILTERGLDVIVMEPCRGGKLAALPEDAHAKLQALDPGASDASFAFRFLMGLPNVKVILSGMNEVAQVEDNLRTFERAALLSKEEEAALSEIAESLKNGVPCTSCRYCCKGCPAGLNISFLLECYNDLKANPKSFNSTMRIDGLPDDKKPAACIGCGQCAHACPQHIDVPAVLANLADLYEHGPNWTRATEGRKAAIRRDLNMD